MNAVGDIKVIPLETIALLALIVIKMMV